jgi:serine/threonine protein kinase
MSIKKGSIVAGKYRLEKGLAQGGMGAVWVARQIQLDRLVAIKFMDAALAEAADGRTRFEREAKASAQIQSPHVVQVHDYGIEDGIPYLVMELLTGEDLAARLRRQRKITLRETTSILVPVTKALRKAHEAGIIHRDLKPANIYISRQDDDEVIKVLDFGIAKVSGPGKAHEATATGVLVGSVHYMSPEQARGFKQIDGRSDLWSLGVIAFRALTGRVPFPGDQLGDVIVRICSDPIPTASELAPELPPEVDRFFEKALARSPNDRFQTAPEWGAAIAALCDAVGAAAPTSQPGSTPWPTGTYPSAIAAGVVKPGERPGATSGTLPSAIAPSSGLPPPPPPESASAGAAERTSAATPLSRSLKVGTAPSGSTAAPTAPSAQAAQAAQAGSAAAQNAPSAVATTPSAVPIVQPPRSTRAPSPSFPGIPPPPPSAPRKPSPSIPMITATPQAAPASKPRSTPAPRAASAESTEEEAPSSVRIPTFEPIAAAPMPDPTSHRTPRPVSAPGGTAAPASSSLLTPPPASPPLFTPPPTSPPLFTPPPASASSRTPFPAPPSSGPPAPSSGPNLTPPPASASLFTPAPASASIITPGPIATPAGAPSSPPSGMPFSSEGPAASELSDLSDDDLKSFRQKSGWAARKRSIAIGAIAVIVGGGILIRLMSGGSDPSADQASSSEQIAAPATQPPPAPTPSLTGSAGPAPTTSTSAAPGPSSSGSADPDKRRKPPGYVKPRVNETLGI